MAELKDVMAYIIANYPKSMSAELSNARLTKMVYLADWHSCLRGKGQISNVDWYFDNYGPFVWDIKRTADKYPDIFKVDEKENMYGSSKRVFELCGDYAPSLTSSEIKSLDHIIKVGSQRYWNDFIKLVYSTYPVSSSERYSSLDLETKADEYRKLRDE